MQLQSDEKFVIVRQLDNPADTNTYYVRAYIRKSLDDTLLDTVNLTDKGSQRFTKSWQVVADPSGEGMYIDIETRIFTDSAYTSESDVYGRQSQTYLVAKRYNPVYGGGGGGGVDYKKVRKIIQEELEKLPQPEKVVIPKPKEVDFSAIIEAIKKIPQPDKVELGGIIRLIERLRTMVEKIPIEYPEQKEVDLSGIIRELKSLSDRIEGVWKENKDATKEDRAKMQETMDKFIKDFTQSTKDKVFIVLNNLPQKDETKPWRKNY